MLRKKARKRKRVKESRKREREKERKKKERKRKRERLQKKKFLFEIDFTVNSFLKRCKLLLLWSLFFVLCKIYAKNYPKKVSSSEFQFKITSFA